MTKVSNLLTYIKVKRFLSVDSLYRGRFREGWIGWLLPLPPSIQFWGMPLEIKLIIVLIAPWYQPPIPKIQLLLYNDKQVGGIQLW